MARLLCYSLRVLQSCENYERLEEVEVGSQQQNNSRDEESGTEDDSDRDRDSDRDSGGDSDGDGDGDSDSNAEAGAEPAIDVFRDARKLYP